MAHEATMLYVTCKNPECRGEIKAPFAVRVEAAFSRVVDAEITCPFCRVTTTYRRVDLHTPSPSVPLSARRPTEGPGAPRGSSGGLMPR